jgi:hypothetical protein
MLQFGIVRIVPSIAVRREGIGRVDYCCAFRENKSRFRVLQTLTCIAWISIAFSGCGKAELRVPTYKASGQLLAADGKAVAGALIVLHPVDSNSVAPRPRATTDGEGRFQLTTYDTGDGAPEGQFIVTVEQWFRDDPNEAPTNHLPPDLGKPDSSGIRISIAKSENTLEPIRLH